MDIYLVGGAVRDKLLNYPHHEQDWVVVGATPEQMEALGYRQVGKDFPIFLHPQTQEEYALARTERKTGPGYTGFVCHSSPQVTLEQDLLRRDLTINAIAETDDGDLIDPFNGRADIEQRILRHVSPAFSEDPLRLLRIARFMARYHHLGFSVAPETLALMQRMVDADEMAHLVPERVWRELQSALLERTPRAFIETLRACGALSKILPELENLFGVPQPPKYHPEIDTGVHVLMALDVAVQLSTVEEPDASKDSDITNRMDGAGEIRYATLLHDLGKGLTSAELWPSHHGHEEAGVALVKALGKHLRVPRTYNELAVLVCRYHTHCHRAMELKPASQLKLLLATDALRRPQRFEQFLLACEADARGRAGLQQRPYPQSQKLRNALDTVQQLDIKPLLAKGYNKEQLSQQIYQARVEALKGKQGQRIM